MPEWRERFIGLSDRIREVVKTERRQTGALTGEKI